MRLGGLNVEACLSVAVGCDSSDGPILWPRTIPSSAKWKLNPSKSKMTDQMKVESLARNKYSFDFGGGGETVVADGTDQPGNAGNHTFGHC